MSNSIALNVDDFENLILKEEAIVLDTRAALDFTQGFIPNSVFIGLDDKFEQWAIHFLSKQKAIIFISSDGNEIEVIEKLNKVGITKILGYLKGGFDTWKKAKENIDLIIDIEVDELAMDIKHDKNIVLIDVRDEAKFANKHIDNAINIPLAQLSDVATIAEFEENKNIYIYSTSAYSSVIAASLFKKEGLHNVRNVMGGWSAIQEQKQIKIK